MEGRDEGKKDYYTEDNRCLSSQSSSTLGFHTTAVASKGTTAMAMVKRLRFYPTVRCVPFYDHLPLTSAEKFGIARWIPTINEPPPSALPRKPSNMDQPKLASYRETVRQKLHLINDEYFRDDDDVCPPNYSQHDLSGGKGQEVNEQLSMNLDPACSSSMAQGPTSPPEGAMAPEFLEPAVGKVLDISTVQQACRATAAEPIEESVLQRFFQQSTSSGPTDPLGNYRASESNNKQKSKGKGNTDSRKRIYTTSSSALDNPQESTVPPPSKRSKSGPAKNSGKNIFKNSDLFTTDDD